MCRSIKTLREPYTTATSQDIEAAALQFVRKVSGFRESSRINTDAFEAAVHEIAASTEALLDSLEVRATAS